MRQTLMNFALHNADAFRAGQTHSRQSGVAGYNPERRQCMVLDLDGDLRRSVHDLATPYIAAAADRLGIDEVALEAREIELSAYGDGDRFATHIDTQEQLASVRVLSCIYYLSPRGGFEGGALRLHGFPRSSEAGTDYTDINPEPDLLLAFPSWMRHEVLPVHAHEGWGNRRFALNIWAHRSSALRAPEVMARS